MNSAGPGRAALDRTAGGGVVCLSVWTPRAGRQVWVMDGRRGSYINMPQ